MSNHDLTRLESPVTPSSGHEESAGSTIGRYKLLQQIGEGGFGTVWMAEQKEPVKRRIALKIIKLGMDTRQVVARFEAERQALALMDHPNIARVLDAGSTEAGRPFFVMELVRGISITQYCDENYLPPEDRLKLFIQVCHAIQHAHQKGIIHRDIKPSNILVTMHDGVPVPKVIDFGIAKATQQELTEKTLFTQYQQFIGTPAYMSPEQAEMSGLDVDTRSDIYSLGVLLYELLTGTTPFDPRELLALGLDVLRKTIREQEPARPSTRLATLQNEARTTTAKRRGLEMPRLIHDLKGDLDWIVMKCLEKDRTRRYETANGLALELKRHLDHEPVVARPPSASYRLQKALYRHRVAFTAGALVTSALLAALVFSGLSYLRERQARLGEQAQRQNAEGQRRAAEAAQADATRQRDLAQARLIDSLIREMRSISAIRQLGYRKDLRDRLRQALELPNAVPLREQLRAEYIQALGDPLSLDPVLVQWSGKVPPQRVPMALSPDGSLAAVWSSLEGLDLRKTASGERVAHFTVDDLQSGHRNFAQSLADPVLQVAIEDLRCLSFSSDAQRLFVAALAPGIDSGPPDRNRLAVAEWRREIGNSWILRPAVQGLFGRLESTGAGVFAEHIKEGSTNRTIEILNLETGSLAAAVDMPPEFSRFTRAVALAPKRGLLAVGTETDDAGYSAALLVLSLTNAEQRVRLPSSAGMGRILAARFSPDERLLACTSESGAVVYETTEFKSLGRLRGFFAWDHSGGAFIQNGETIAFSQGQRPGLRLLSLFSGVETALKTPYPVHDLTASADGSTLMFKDPRGLSIVRLSDTPERRRLSGHLGGVTAVEFSPDGRLLASTGKDGSVRFWDAASGVARRVIDRPKAIGQSVSFSPDGRWLAVGDFQHDQIQIFSVQTGQPVLSLGEALSGVGLTWSCAFTPDGRRLLSAGVNGLTAWEFVGDPGNLSGPPEGRLLFTEEGNFLNLLLDPGGQWAAYSGFTPVGKIFLKALTSQAPNFSLPSPISWGVQSMSIAPDGTELAFISDQRDQIYFWNVRAREVARTIPLLAPGEIATTSISSLRFSPDGLRLAGTSGGGHSIHLMDPSSGRRLYSLPEEPGVIWWLAWHPDGRRLAITRDNGDLSVWNLDQVETALAEVNLSP